MSAVPDAFAFIFAIRSVRAAAGCAGRPVERRSSPFASVSPWLRV